MVCGRLGAWLRAEESQGTLDDLQSLNICYLGLELVNAPFMKNESETRIQWRRRPAPTSQHHRQAGRLSRLRPAESCCPLRRRRAPLCRPGDPGRAAAQVELQAEPWGQQRGPSGAFPVLL